MFVKYLNSYLLISYFISKALKNTLKECQPNINAFTIYNIFGHIESHYIDPPKILRWMLPLLLFEFRCTDSIQYFSPRTIRSNIFVYTRKRFRTFDSHTLTRWKPHDRIGAINCSNLHKSWLTAHQS